jgi:hypothetical protein
MAVYWERGRPARTVRQARVNSKRFSRFALIAIGTLAVLHFSFVTSQLPYSIKAALDTLAGNDN